MRFFLDLVSCCRSSTLRSADPTGSTKPLVPPDSGTLRRKKRRAPDWRPSLGSISEDGAAVPRRQTATTVGPGRDVRWRSSSGAVAPAAAAAAKVHHRNYSDDYEYDNGRNAMPTIMPAFSPTPFMF